MQRGAAAAKPRSECIHPRQATRGRSKPAAASRWCERERSRGERGDGVSEEPSAALTDRAPPRYTVGAADRPGSASPRLCLSENIQNGNLTPLLKIAEFAPIQLEVPPLKCVTTVSKYLVLSPKGSMSSQEGGNAQASSSGPRYWVLLKNRHREGASAERPPPSPPAPRRPLPAARPLPGQRARAAPRSSGQRARAARAAPRSPDSEPELPRALPARAAALSPPRGKAQPQRRSPHWTLLGRSSGLQCTAHSPSAPSALNPWPSPVRGRPHVKKR